MGTDIKTSTYQQKITKTTDARIRFLGGYSLGLQGYIVCRDQGSDILIMMTLIIEGMHCECLEWRLRLSTNEQRGFADNLSLSLSPYVKARMV